MEDSGFGFGIVAFIYLAVIIIAIAGMWKTFEKAGQPGWAAIVPIYNVFVMLEIIKKPWWWFLMLLIPGVNLVFTVWMYNLISKSFGKGVGFTLGLIFLSFIFWPILGFGDARYQGSGIINPDALDSNLS